MSTAMGAVDDYFGTLDGTTRAAYERIRRLALQVAPGGRQGTSYGVAALMHSGRPLLGFRAAKAHLSIFPFSSAAIDAVRDRLRAFDVSRGTIRFTADRPLPEDVVREIVRARMAEIDSGPPPRSR
jgi:uncharacterized protein YdhG (YjbR/CyaY superfamily)